MDMFKTWSLKAKLLSAFTVAAFVMMLLGGFAYFSMSRVVTTYKWITDVTLPSAVALANLRGAQKDSLTAVVHIIGGENTLEQANRSQADFDEAMSRYEVAAKAYA